jgi:hypothetical protein
MLRDWDIVHFLRLSVFSIIAVTYAMGRELVGTVPRKRGTQELN